MSERMVSGRMVDGGLTMWAFDHVAGWSRVPDVVGAGKDWGARARQAGFVSTGTLGVEHHSGMWTEVWEGDGERFILCVSTPVRYFPILVDGLPSFLALVERLASLAVHVMASDRETGQAEDRRHERSLNIRHGDLAR